VQYFSSVSSWFPFIENTEVISIYPEITPEKISLITPCPAGVIVTVFGDTLDGVDYPELVAAIRASLQENNAEIIGIDYHAV
jgi:hypothetical protein